MKKLLFLLIILVCPYTVFAADLIPNADSGILVEANSGKIIFEKEKDKEVSIASMTKMVAQIIILEEIEANKIKWSDIVTVSRNASGMGGSQIYLEEGEKMSVKDLMKGISVASGNDATVAMAEYISGSEEKFVDRMNKKVKELGLKHTHFKNSTGLDEDGHYSSSYDMAVVARELVINHPDILKFSSIYEDYLRQDTNNKFWLVNTNKLIAQYEGTDGLKTGHTDQAGYCLAATTKKNDIRLIAIVLGEDNSKIRNKETIELLEYGFQNVKLKKLKDAGSVIKTITYKKSDKKQINAILKDNLNVVEDSSDNSNYKYKIVITKKDLPIVKNEVIGSIQVTSKGNLVSSGELISSSTIKPYSLLELYLDNIKQLIYGNF